MADKNGQKFKMKDLHNINIPNRMFYLPIGNP